MRRFLAIGAAVLIVVLAVTVCCRPMARGCCKGHCMMSPAPAFAVPPAKNVLPKVAVVATVASDDADVREWTMLPESGTTSAWQRFDPNITIQLRI